MKERSMYRKIARLFDLEYDIFYEVKLPYSQRRADLLCMSTLDQENPELVIVEAKIHDHKKAIKQAYNRLFYVDKSYIAIHHKNIANIDVELLGRFGLGLISVDGQATIIRNAKKSNRIIPRRKEELIKSINRKNKS